MRISYCRHRFDPASELKEVEDLRTLATDKVKDDAPLWSPCLFSEGSRKEDKATELSALVLDYDYGRPANVAVFKLGIAHIWHTSASHTPEKPKWRLIVPFSSPVPAKAWKDFWLNAVTMLQLTGFDEACKNVSRFYFVPPKGCIWEEHKGRLLDPKEFLESSGEESVSALRKALLSAKNIDYVLPIRAALHGKPLANEGSRDTVVTGLGFYLGRSVVADSVSVDSVVTLLRRGLAMPGREPLEHWEKKFTDAFVRGRKARGEAEADSRKELKIDDLKELQTASKLDGSVVILSNTYNACLILQHSPMWRFRHNLLEDCIEISESGQDFRPLTDNDSSVISNWLQKEYRIKITKLQAYDQISVLAAPYDPLRLYLTGLKWDKSTRIDRFLTDYLSAQDKPLNRIYSRKWLISLVARALEPGCKVDTVLVLQGEQGLGKSKALRALAEPWFSDSPIVIGDKDSLIQSSRFWLHEMAELASFRRAQVETIRNFISSPEDSYRPPYGRAVVTRPRRCIYVGTTNSDTFLTDEEGNRRFWPVRCIGEIDEDKIRRDRGQILAEARDAYLNGEKWYLELEESRQQKEAVLEFEVDRDAGVENAIREWWQEMPIVQRPRFLTIDTVVKDIIGSTLDKRRHTDAVRAAKAFRNLKWTRHRFSEGGDRFFAYQPPAEWLNMPQKKGGRVVDFKLEDGNESAMP